MSQKNDEFYVGYLPQAPSGVAAFVRSRTLFILVTAVFMGALLAASQSPFAASVFEFGNYRSFEGIISLKPYPMIRLDRPGETAEAGAFSRYYLVNEFKYGADEAVAAYDGKRVRLEGTLIYRDDQTMIEVRSGKDIKVLGEGSAGGDGVSFGQVALTGEIVDSKCFLGVMNPGNLKAHKSCAVRCISGGIPPILVVRDPSGAARYYMLTAADGSAVNKQVLDLVAEPLSVKGELVRYDNLWVLKSDPATYTRIRK